MVSAASNINLGRFTKKIIRIRNKQPSATSVSVSSPRTMPHTKMRTALKVRQGE